MPNLRSFKKLWAFGGLYSVQWILPVAAIPTSDHVENGWDKFGPKNVTTTFWDLRVLALLVLCVLFSSIFVQVILGEIV